MRLRKYSQIKADPAMAILMHLENADLIAENKTRKMVAETLEAIIQDFRKKVDELIIQLENSIPSISKEIAKELKEYTLAYPELFKGEKGDSIKGEKGDSIVGPPGPEGEPGKSIVGPPGKDGRNPEPKEIVPFVLKEIPEQKPEDIAKKLNTLEEKVKINVISGLSQIIEDIKSNIRRGMPKSGGGMGNVIEETPSGSVNGTNTIFTLSTRPKTNALLVFVQGQMQDSTHYTLAGTTLTLDWAPVTGMEVRVWYVR